MWRAEALCNLPCFVDAMLHIPSLYDVTDPRSLRKVRLVFCLNSTWDPHPICLILLIPLGTIEADLAESRIDITNARLLTLQVHYAVPPR